MCVKRLEKCGNMQYLSSYMIFLMDRRLIVAEGYGKVHILTSDGKLQKQLSIFDGYKNKKM